jgi:hypothetical protein
MSMVVKARNRFRSQAAVTVRSGQELADPEARRLVWVGADPESDSNECPAVALMPETGDFLFRGKTVTEPAVITALNQHIGKADDESDVWLPARMAPLIRDALDGYDKGRCGPGQHTVTELIAAASASVIRFTLGDSGDEASLGAGGRTGDSWFPWLAGDCDAVRAAAARGVTVRGLQVLRALPRDRQRHSHGRACGSGTPVDIRSLPRARAADLLLPGADCWVFDYRLIRWDFPGRDSGASRPCAFSSDPRIVRDIAAAFEIAWSRAAPALAR